MENKNFKKIVIGILIVIITALGGYMYYKRTPSYTFNLIRDSIQKHDYDTFNKHVDAENLIALAFDDITTQILENDEHIREFRGLAEGFIKIIKPNVVASLNDELKQFVKNGAIKSSNKAGEKNEIQQTVNNMKKKTDFDNMKLKTIGSSVKDGDFTIVDIIFEDKKLARDFTMKLRMKQLEDGTWQILSVSNLREFINEVVRVELEKLAEINKPIQEDIDKKIQTIKPQVRVVYGDEWGFSKILRAEIPVTVSVEKKLARVIGEIVLSDSSGNNKTFVFDRDFSVGAGEYVLRCGWKLNQFIPSDNEIIKSDLEGYNSTVHISGIEFEDGSKIELKHEIE